MEPRRLPFAPTTDAVAVEAHVRWVIDAIDKNADGGIDEEELAAYFSDHPDGIWGRDIRHRQGYAFGRGLKYAHVEGMRE